MNKRYSEGNNIPYPLVSTWSDYIELDFIPSKIIILVEQINTESNFMGVYENGHFYVNAKVGSVTYFHNYSDNDIEISGTKFRIKGFTSYFNNTVFSYTAVADIPILPPLPASKLIFDGKVYGSVIYGGDDMINYSTQEQKTGQKWIDGKDIYTKTIVTTSPTSTGYTEIANISDLNADTVWVTDKSYLTYTIETGEDVYLSINSYRQGTIFNIWTQVQNSKIAMTISSTDVIAGKTVVLVIEYTKTTG